MATAMITIKNGKIIGYEGRYFDCLSEDGKRCEGNGWTVAIKRGKIICHAERVYSDGVHRCHREFKLADGVVGLAGGNIDDRYAYFRSEAFQTWMHRRGITAVKHQDPNRIYEGFSNYSGWGTASQKVWSDGQVTHRYEDDSRKRAEFNSPGANPNLWSGTDYHEVTGATWALVETSVDYRDSHNYSCILYTNIKNVMSIKDIPDREAVRETAEAVEALLDPVQGCLDLAIADQAIASQYSEVALGLPLGRKGVKLHSCCGASWWGYEVLINDESLLFTVADRPTEGSKEALQAQMDTLGGMTADEIVAWLDDKNVTYKPERCWFKVVADLEQREVRIHMSRHVHDMRRAQLSGNYGNRPVWVIKVD